MAGGCIPYCVASRMVDGDVYVLHLSRACYEIEASSGHWWNLVL